MLKQLSLSLCVISGVSARTVSEKRLENGVGRTPALGWNSWV
jgi:alpha-galactosidase